MIKFLFTFCNFSIVIYMQIIVLQDVFFIPWIGFVSWLVAFHKKYGSVNLIQKHLW